MHIEMTSSFEGLIFVFSLFLIPPILFYLVAVLGGNRFKVPILFLFLSMIIIVFIMLGIFYLTSKTPLFLLGINILVACGAYYFWKIRTPARASIQDELVYHSDLKLFGKVKTYEEEHYALSGSTINPKKRAKLQYAIRLLFHENGAKQKEYLTNRGLSLTLLRVNEYFYNDMGQLIRHNNNVLNTDDYTLYTYNEAGQIEQLWEKTARYYVRTQRTDCIKKTAYTYRPRSVLIESVIEETRVPYHWEHHTPETTVKYDTPQKQVFNENGLLIAEGEVKEGIFLCNTKYTYNQANQLIRKIAEGEHITYEYDKTGHLTKKSMLNKETIIEYDTLGNWELYIKKSDRIDQHKQILFAENEYDSHQNLIRKTIFIKENKKPKRPYYLVEIDLTYYQS